LTAQDWLVLVYMGVGPMGLAFYLWDFGMKKGNTGTTTTLRYATPVLSTIFLGFHAEQKLSPTLWLGVAMVTASIALARSGKKARAKKNKLFEVKGTVGSSGDAPTL
jgi:drug/metabolite transporter (DMT)-like permease